MAQRKSQLPFYLTVFAAGGVGYYLYTAGGEPKVAQKKFEEDVSHASSTVKANMLGREDEAEKKVEKWGAQAGSKVDATAADIKSELNKAGNSVDQYRKDIGKSAMNSIDAADRKVEEAASKAKGGVSGWFGLGGK